MTIQLDGTVVATTMRTPGNDFELAVGFCVTDGLLGDAAVTGVRYCADGPATASALQRRDGRDRGTGAARRAPAGPDVEQLRVVRQRAASTSCSPAWRRCRRPTRSPTMCWRPCPGGCSAARACSGRPVPCTPPRRSIATAAWSSPVRTSAGTTRSTRWSGRCSLEGALPASGHGLFVSGRASVEMVQKAWAAGFGTVVAVSAPTALAVHAARRAEIALVGFVRDDGSFNMYARSLSSCAPRPGSLSSTCSASPGRASTGWRSAPRSRRSRRPRARSSRRRCSGTSATWR